MLKASFNVVAPMLKICTWLFLWALAHPLYALTIHYNPDRSDSLKACDQLSYRGDQKPAQRCYTSLLESDVILDQANAAAALGDIRRANRLFRQAASESNDPTIKTDWARLYLQTHQISDAEALYREALLYQEDFLPAQLGLAEALSETFEGQARERLQAITAQHPDNVQALLLLARIELELQNVEVARGLLNRALAEVRSQQIPPLEIYALHAAANLLEGESLQPWINRALLYNPGYGSVYSIPAHFYIITYRYREAVDLYQKAVDVQPDLAAAHRDLGINQLRINNVFAARYHLQKAYQLDPYNIETVNTLRFLDDNDKMRVRVVDVPSLDDPNDTLGRVYIRLDREDADALEPYVVDLSIRAVQVFTEKYNFRLKQPMIVELYHDHDDFGVRTVSTPGIGLLGVTFGYLTAMDSPKARPAGDFHWGSTLWHEIAHVFTLEATNHLLPRWFSEGLSVYEEWSTGPLADRELSMDVLQAMANQQLLPIAQLDQGFVRPSYSSQVQVSYMQAGLICEFIAVRWGQKALESMLMSFASGMKTEEALEAAIGIDSSTFDNEFTIHLANEWGDLTNSLDDYILEARQIERAMRFEDYVSVEALARDLIRRYPQRVGTGNPYQILANALEEQGQADDAMEVLLQWHDIGGHDPESLLSLIESLRAADRQNDAVRVMESLNWVMPYYSDVHRWLGQHYLAEGEAELAMREFDALLGMELAEDAAEAHFGKAQAAMLKNDSLTARRQVLYSLENAPFFRPAQQLLLSLSAGE